MPRVSSLSIVIAYPGTLGGPIPSPPPGYAWLLDDAGNIITDNEGVKISVPVASPPPSSGMQNG